MAYRTRLTLINKTGKEMIRLLTEQYPDITWYLTLKGGREICVGMKDNITIVVGSDYETIVDNLEVR